MLCLLSLNDHRTESCKESLKQLGEIAGEADDLRAQALHDCCQFDALLEFGMWSYTYNDIIVQDTHAC